MGNKNHRRYKLRRHMNAIKHEPKKLFSEPPIFIHGWKDLIGLENDRYIIVVEEGNCRGWIKPKFEVPDEEYFEHYHYLSTHTFYGGQYFYSTAMLRKFGFNVQLENWDGETIYCPH